jgi:hypothetical protein
MKYSCCLLETRRGDIGDEFSTKQTRDTVVLVQGDKRTLLRTLLQSGKPLTNLFVELRDIVADVW